MDLATKLIQDLATAQGVAMTILVVSGLYAALRLMKRGERDSDHVHQMYADAHAAQLKATEAQLATARALESLVNKVEDLRQDITPRRRS